MKRSTDYESNTKTVGQFGLQFGRYENNIESTYREASDVLYKGRVEDVPDKVWETVASIHENFSDYQAMAMMPLYKGRGRYAKGTESPKDAVLSVLTNLEEGFDYEYVIIWKITGAGHFQDRENFKVLLRCVAGGDKKIWRSETGKFVAAQSFQSWIDELEEKEGTKYHCVPIVQALMEALHGSKYDMGSEEEADWRKIRKAFNLQDLL